MRNTEDFVERIEGIRVDLKEIRTIDELRKFLVDELEFTKEVIRSKLYD